MHREHQIDDLPGASRAIGPQPRRLVLLKHGWDEVRPQATIRGGKVVPLVFPAHLSTSSGSAGAEPRRHLVDPVFHPHIAMHGWMGDD